MHNKSSWKAMNPAKLPPLSNIWSYGIKANTGSHHWMLYMTSCRNRQRYVWIVEISLMKSQIHQSFVTGLWKTDQIVRLGLFYYIGPANGYTCTLHIHSAITRLVWLVCFSRASFTHPVNSRLVQWDTCVQVI